MVMIEFVCGREGRISEMQGPFPYVQITYGWVYTNDGNQTLADRDESGDWCTPDGQLWSDFIVSAV